MSDDYKQANVYSPRGKNEYFHIQVSLNRDEGGVQAVRNVRCDKSNHSPATRQAIKDTLLAARSLELASVDRWIATVSISPEPNGNERGWELALVLADRMARGVGGQFSKNNASKVYAYGYSDDWESGKFVEPSMGSAVLALSNMQECLTGNDLLLLGDSTVANDINQHRAGVKLEKALPENVVRIDHIGAMLGTPDAADVVRRYRVWFPLVGGEDCLAWVQVTARPRTLAERAALAEGNAHAAPTLLGVQGVSIEQKVRKVLETSQIWDGNTAHHWHITVRFSQLNIQDNSWQLALVLADRVARRREIAPKGRLIATGKAASSETDWSTGNIASVDYIERKLEIIKRAKVQEGDRLLLPQPEQGSIPSSFVIDELRSNGVTVAWVNHLRIGG